MLLEHNSYDNNTGKISSPLVQCLTNVLIGSSVTTIYHHLSVCKVIIYRLTFIILVISMKDY